VLSVSSIALVTRDKKRVETSVCYCQLLWAPSRSTTRIKYHRIALHYSQTSGVARISKLGGTPVTWPEGPMRGGFFGEGQHSGPLSPSARRSEESCHYTPPLPPKISSDLHESCGHASRQWGACPPPRGHATVPDRTARPAS